MLNYWLKNEDQQKIIITGSHIKRTDLEEETIIDVLRILEAEFNK